MAVEGSEMAMKPTVVLYPMSGVGHLLPMVELAKLFLRHDFAVAVVLMQFPIKHPSLDSFISSVSAAHPSISFHQLPPPDDSFIASVSTTFPSIPMTFDGVRPNNHELLRFLAAHRRENDVRAVVLDFLCTVALDVVVAELDIPAYFFIATGASALASMLYFPSLELTDPGLGELADTPFHFPGLPPIPASDMPREVMDPASESCECFVNKIAPRLPDGDAFLINSFELLEAEAVKALREGACLPGRRMPKIYCIGPLITEGSRGKDETKAECMAWLDAQPRDSVVFLCFGSMGSFSVEQLKQIAVGLERSGQRFLWVVGIPKDPPTATSELDLDVLLPEGFLERTKQRGMVAKSWAPQVEVLNHGSVGCFVSHCGWNSTLEAISAGVAIVAWPLYAEQRMNKVFLVEQMKLAVVMEGYDREMVEADEVEAKVRWVMESEGGRELRRRAAAAKEMAAEAWSERGSSRQAWLDLVKTLKLKI
ncbi:UDP-glycosyltransferase 13-like [Curcuma longa]|uniref:UDP-glycosyltransferase 13-like n=1 Tax=Curcuma longa TaxID=136217 RepID=UPI003D9EB0EF